MTDSDSPWKEALDRYFEPFMALFFPLAHSEIDWGRAYEPLDKELQQIVREGEIGRRLVDKLVRVWRVGGEEEWVLIHLEVQGTPETDFELRMYIYHYRIFDRYGRQVVSLAVLADERNSWRPGQFGYNLWGCSLDFRFPAAKLLDLADEALEQSSNFFAAVVLAHRAAQRTAGNDDTRQMKKLSLVRRLYEYGLAANDVRELFRLIDWFLVLPPEMEDQVWREVERIEQEKQMPFVTSVERIGIRKGIEQGMQQGIQQGLEQAVELTLTAKFGEEGRALMSDVRQHTGIDILQSLLRLIPTAASMDEVRVALNRQA